MSVQKLELWISQTTEKGVLKCLDAPERVFAHGDIGESSFLNLRLMFSRPSSIFVAIVIRDSYLIELS